MATGATALETTMRYELCSEKEFTQRIYDHLTKTLALKEGITVEEVRRLVPLTALSTESPVSLAPDPVVTLSKIAEGVYDDETSDTLFRLDLEVYEEMGCPETITITISPGGRYA